MRQIVLDTETTGLSTAQGHRVIEIGCIELVNRRITGREYHRFLDPERDIDEGAERVHVADQGDGPAPSDARHLGLPEEELALVEGIHEERDHPWVLEQR